MGVGPGRAVWEGGLPVGAGFAYTGGFPETGCGGAWPVLAMLNPPIWLERVGLWFRETRVEPEAASPPPMEYPFDGPNPHEAHGSYAPPLLPH